MTIKLLFKAERQPLSWKHYRLAAVGQESAGKELVRSAFEKQYLWPWVLEIVYL